MNKKITKKTNNKRKIEVYTKEVVKRYEKALRRLAYQ